MTIDDYAREIVHTLLDEANQEDWLGIVRLCLAHLERETLERAAIECDQEAAEAGRIFGEWQDSARICADRIRSLATATESTAPPTIVRDTRPS